MYHTYSHNYLLHSHFSFKADLGISDNHGRTALHYAVICKSLPCAQAIVETKVWANALFYSIITCIYICPAIVLSLSYGKPTYGVMILTVLMTIKCMNLNEMKL